MTRERIELNGQDDSRNSPRVRPLRGGNSGFSAPDDPEEINSRVIDLDLDADDEAQFLRTQRRIPVRRGPLAKKTANRVKVAAKLAILAIMAGAAAITAYGYAAHAARFRIESSDDIDIFGVHNASRTQVMEIAGSDIGRNIFFVPLDERRRQLERIPWVQSASVMRLLPNRLAVSIAERTPVAKVQIGGRVNLIDAEGVVMGPPASRQTKFSFPVIHGITESEPLSSRAAAMKIYTHLVRDLDSDPSMAYTRQLSEVDLSDPEDVKVTAGDPAGTVVIHLGNSDFLQRYRIFAEHVNEWRKQAGSLQSVDLRYEGQVIVNPDQPKAAEKSGDRGIGTSGLLKPKPVATAKKARKKKK
ncbi:MAG TPA: FtsQ-type POTRA domain-containing protein [Candidatus Angelobacter sp.]|nr:FtsQ-type POTRA domain-containing protein [Candidatus Angelobacter sp.]